MARYVFVPTGGVVESDSALRPPLYEPLPASEPKPARKAHAKAPARRPAQRARKAGGEG